MEYIEAYEEMTRATATEKSPWYVVPADNKWFTRAVVAAANVETLATLHLKHPKVGKDKLDDLAALKAQLLKEWVAMRERERRMRGFRIHERTHVA